MSSGVKNPPATFATIVALLAAASSAVAFNSQAITGVASLSVGTSVASAGDVRGTSTFAVKALRSGGGGDIAVLTIDGSDGIVVGGATNAASVTLNSKTGGFQALQINNVESVRWNSTQQLLTVPQIQWVAAAATPNLGQVQATSGIGQMHTWYAQQGFAGSIGGILRIGGGGGGTSGTNLAGATQIDLGTAVASVSALCSFLVGGASVLDISQSAASVSYIKSSARLQLSGTSLNITDNSANPIISYNITTNQVCVFKDINFGSSLDHVVNLLAVGGTGTTVGNKLTVSGGVGQNQTGGSANNAGGKLILQGGLPGTGGGGAAALSGDVQIDLGTAVSNVSALCSFLVGGASELDISKTSANTTTMTTANTSGRGLTITVPNSTGTLLLQSSGASSALQCNTIGTGSLRFNGTTRLSWNTTGLAFYATAPIALQTGVAVTAAGVHAACVALGLFTA